VVLHLEYSGGCIDSLGVFVTVVFIGVLLYKLDGKTMPCYHHASAVSGIHPIGLHRVYSTPVYLAEL